MRIGLGGNDGRCNFSSISKSRETLTIESIMTFKAHKSEKGNLYPVNCMGFHPERRDFFFILLEVTVR